MARRQLEIWIQSLKEIRAFLYSNPYLPLLVMGGGRYDQEIGQADLVKQLKL